ncbi:hypothetical protein DB35_14990 [Streptomyces abyssalis]|uniref:Uncharacterized protein n=1 Tax=Streptomyces abyssalis TaxID=933944 RepID=A0A1E7JG25_9ACTN|nr:hypothetical protein [Streptomyces abyssalis]OEU85421.1 hypothetical protein AN215_23020 [Streptomyces abyssalis]OEU93116.1 hypothetical protein DB35_14990 [Streptomyces abyssalis]OEV26875.1 hypothetical protein AN219_24155 [Streptomyces nanshensis]
MYEPIRSKSVHAMAEADFPHRSREEELDIRLAGHLTALLTVTDELRAVAPAAELDEAAEELAAQVTRLRNAPLRAAPTERDADPAHIDSLHHRAHTLAGHAVVIATYRDDEPAMVVASQCRDFHASALGLTAA